MYSLIYMGGQTLIGYSVNWLPYNKIGQQSPNY